MLSISLFHNKVNILIIIVLLSQDTLTNECFFSHQDNISSLNLRNIWLSGPSMDLFISGMETKARLTQLIVPYIASDKLLVKYVKSN